MQEDLQTQYLDAKYCGYIIRTFLCYGFEYKTLEVNAIRGHKKQ